MIARLALKATAVLVGAVGLLGFCAPAWALGPSPSAAPADPTPPPNWVTLAVPVGFLAIVIFAIVAALVIRRGYRDQ